MQLARKVQATQKRREKNATIERGGGACGGCACRGVDADLGGRAHGDGSAASVATTSSRPHHREELVVSRLVGLVGHLQLACRLDLIAKPREVGPRR